MTNYKCKLNEILINNIMEDANSMCERILKTLENIFRNDPDLREFSIVPTENNTKNKSPVLYEEHNIGLESWCIKYIYRYACKELFDIRHLLRRRKLTFDRKQQLNHLLIGVLLINPDVTTFWNMKRELVDEQILMLDNELQFTKIVLSYKSKSNETLMYRRWLLKRIVQKSHNTDSIRNLLEKELEMCEMAAEKSPNNYHAWNHRRWIIENFFNRIDDNNRLILDELEFSYQWIMKHVSEHAGYNYRQYLIDFVRTNNSRIFVDYLKIITDHFGFVYDNEYRNFLIRLFGKNNVELLENNHQLINFVCLLLYDLLRTTNELHRIYPGHESLWYHRRYLVYRLLETIYNYYELTMNFNVKLDDSNFIQTTAITTNQLNIVDFDRLTFFINNNELKKLPNKITESLIYRTLIKNESDFIEKSVSTYFENEYAKRYEKWLKLVLCLDLS